MQLERTNCKRNALICMQIRLKGSPCVCACVCGPECLTAKTWHKAKGGNCLHIHMQSHTHTYSPTHGGGKSCHNKSRIDSWQAKRLQRQETETETPRKYATNMKRTHTHPQTHTYTQDRMQTTVCNTDLQSCQVTSFAYNSNCFLSLISFFFRFLLTYMPSGWGPCCVLNARLKAGNACFLRLLYAYLMSAVRWVYHNNNDVHTHTKRQAHACTHTHVRLTLTVTVKL